MLVVVAAAVLPVARSESEPGEEGVVAAWDSVVAQTAMVQVQRTER